MAYVTCFNRTQLCLCVCSQTRGQLIAKAWFATRPRGATRQQQDPHSCTRTESLSNQKGYLLKQTRPAQRKLVLPQRQTAFRQTPSTVITTLPTGEAVNPNPGGAGSWLPSSLCAFSFPFFNSNWAAFLSYDCAQTHLLPQCVFACCCRCVCLCVRMCAPSERLRVSVRLFSGWCVLHTLVNIIASPMVMWPHGLLWLAGGGARGIRDQRGGGLNHRQGGGRREGRLLWDVSQQWNSTRKQENIKTLQ